MVTKINRNDKSIHIKFTLSEKKIIFPDVSNEIIGNQIDKI